MSDAEVTKFREDAFIKLKNVFSPSTIGILRRQLISEVMKRLRQRKQKQKFLSLDLIWEKNQVIKEFVVNKISWHCWLIIESMQLGYTTTTFFQKSQVW